jgi:hypothetical protein
MPTLSGHSDRHRLNGRFQGATAIHFFESVVNSSANADVGEFVPVFPNVGFRRLS